MKKAKRNSGALKFLLITLLGFGVWTLGFNSFAQAKEFDGIWFMGFNTQKEPFTTVEVRQAVNHAINVKDIAIGIMSTETTPVSIIPPTMLGYDPDIAPLVYDVKEAKNLMKNAGYPMNDKRLKNISMLHTSGIKTKEIAEYISSNLKNIGMKVELVEVDTMDEDKWVDELASGKHNLFLMGYKADIGKLFTEEATTSADSYSLIEPLFGSKGTANFTGYKNPEIDTLLEQISGFKLVLASERHTKLKEVNQKLYKDLPAIVLFYIEKL
ncbi:MAG: hypothetical protein KKA31_05305 [Candidatus Margulisbacteria bacterium]|nr:hypothetical protein [Candidatus Margulisiibacteriota bacterium]